MFKRIRPQSGARRVIVDYGLTALVAIVMAIVVQTFVVKPYLIPSTSMANTLVPGQRVLVDRMVYRYRSVHRGDIIVFRRPEPPHDVLIKRVVGLPGDLLAVRNGHLFVNGVRQNEPFVDKVDGVA
jgi:signal peptidase I